MSRHVPPRPADFSRMMMFAQKLRVRRSMAVHCVGERVGVSGALVEGVRVGAGEAVGKKKA